jgi:two-component system, cell cycle sensor histidine kinase and response regulator CckA
MLTLKNCTHKRFKRADLFLDKKKYYICFVLLLLILITSLFAVVKPLPIMLIFFISTGMFIIARTINKFIEELFLQSKVLEHGIASVSCFYMILRADNSVLYCDSGFHKIFNDDKKNSHLSEVDFLIQTNLLSQAQKTEIFTWLKERTQDPVVISTIIPDLGEMQILLKSFAITDGAKENLAIICGFKQKTISDFCLKRLFFDRKKLGYYSFDDAGNILDCNEIFSLMLGYNNRQELIDMNLAALINPQIAEKISYKKTFYTKNKTSVLAFEFDLSTEKNIFRRIVTIPSKEDLALEMENYLHYLISNCPIAGLIIDHEAVIENTNLAFEKMLNLEMGNKKLSLLDLVHEDSKEEVHKVIQAVINEESYSAQGSFKTIEVKLNINLEKDISVSLYLNKLSNLENTSKKLFCHIIDASDRKNLEMNFVHSQKMQAVGQLAGGIAHDFNNLLTAMMGFCDLLLMRHPPGDQSFADIMQIKQNTNRAAGLVRQLLAFSRKQVLQPEIIDITHVLDELSNLIRRLIGENIELNMNHGRDLWLLKADQGQLEQVIINLAVNARDSMSNGGILTIQTSNVVINFSNSLDNELISAAIEEKIEPGEYVKIDIADTGTGIPKHVISKIFEPFFTTKEVGAGTGLGLSTVYGIIKQTGGYIYLATELNKGTKFCIFLKRFKTQDDVVDLKTPPINKHEIIGVADLTGAGTILVVEDEIPVRIFVVHALRQKGYQVYEAEDGDQALEIIEQYGNEIDVIITDVIMPGMNGPAVVEEIRLKHPDIKVIFISGYAEDAFIKQYGADNKFNFLSKPFTLKQLVVKVKEILCHT